MEYSNAFLEVEEVELFDSSQTGCHNPSTFGKDSAHSTGDRSDRRSGYRAAVGKAVLMQSGVFVNSDQPGPRRNAAALHPLCQSSQVDLAGTGLPESDPGLHSHLAGLQSEPPEDGIEAISCTRLLHGEGIRGDGNIPPYH